MTPIASPTANFLLVPQEFFACLLQSGLEKHELLAALYMASRVFGLPPRTSFFTVEEVAAATGSDVAELAPALASLVGRGLVIRLDVEGGEASRFVLNTDDAAQFMQYYDAAPAAAPVPEPPLAPDPITGEIKRPAAPLPAGPAVPEPITKALGRSLTREELERIEECGATEAELLAALEGVAARGLRLYTSDQIVYEHERRGRRPAAPKPGRESARTRRTRLCTTCGGAGYLLSTNTRSIRVCDCKN